MRFPKIKKIIFDRESLNSDLSKTIQKNVTKYSTYKDTNIEITNDYHKTIREYQLKF